MKKILFFCLFACNLVCNAQVDFEPGYFITSDGTKNNVFIKNQGLKGNPIDFEYVYKIEEKPQKATISGISEFQIENENRFKRYTVNIDRSSSRIDKIDFKKSPNWNTETLFLKLIVEGEINLYEYVGGEIIRFFISSGNHETVEQLVYKEYYISQSKLGKNTDYKQQLFLKLNSANFTEKEFERLKYNQSDLKNLLIKYNKVKVKDFVNIEVKEKKGSLHLKVVAGANYNSLSYNYNIYVINPGVLHGYEYDFENKINLSLGFEAEYVLPFYQNKWSVFVNPNFQSYKADGIFRDEKMSAEYKFVEIPIGIRYGTFLNKKSKLFFDLGYSLIFNFDSYVDYAAYGGNKFELNNSGSFLIGTGYSYGPYAVEARYNLKRQLISDDARWNSKLFESQFSSISLLFSYKFF